MLGLWPGNDLIRELIMKTVIITEKKDQAKKIASTLGFKDDRGSYQGTFNGSEAVIVWARGHLLTLQSPEEVVDGLTWSTPEKLTPIPRTYQLKVLPDTPGKPPASQAKQYIKNIGYHMRGCTTAIIATDADREGEAIGWMILGYLNYAGPVMRAWLARGLDKKSIQEAFSDLKDPSVTKSWYRASEARSRSDWSYMFLVRAYTYYARYGVFGTLLGSGRGRAGVMSVGRVQTPALAMVVRRDEQIKNFVSIDHFKVKADISVSPDTHETTYQPIVSAQIVEQNIPGIHWEEQKPDDKGNTPLPKPMFIDKASVEAFRGRLLQGASSGTVSSFAKKTRNEQPPKTFSLSDAQAKIGQSLQISAGLVQTVLEDLYEQEWLSYARTAKSELPANLHESAERNAMLGAVSSLPELEEAAKTAMAIHNGTHESISPFTPKVYVSKTLEHHGIVPTTRVMTKSAFDGLTPKKADGKSIKHTKAHMQQAYLLVAKQYIQALYPAAVWHDTQMSITVAVEDLLRCPQSVFVAKGKHLHSPGWRNAFSAKSASSSALTPAAEGARATIQSVDISSAKTTPPKPYTTTSFPKAMESVGKEVQDPKLRKRLASSEGIGTPATRKAIIDTLQSRGYIDITKEKIFSTDKGRSLIQSVPPWLASPEMTALWEDALVNLCTITTDAKAIDVRDKFVSKQTERVESLIEQLHTQCKGKMLDKPIAQAPAKVSDRMKKAIKSIANSKNLTVPKGALSDPVKAKAFFDEHADDLSNAAPSKGQLEMAKKIMDCLPAGEQADQSVLSSRKACSDFISANKQYLPPTVAARNFAQKLLDDMPEAERPKDTFLNSAESVSKFIDAQLKKNRKGKTGKGSTTKGRRGRSSPIKSKGTRRKQPA